jgi:alpha-1,3/alpha-1,6-mannosyltransferase
LGLGGAERLVVDAAVELAQLGHTVDMYTAYYDPERCFDETRSGQFAVITAGNWFPRHILGRFIAICAIIRCTLAALYLAMRVWSGNIPDYDVIIVDQVAAVVPLLKMLLPGTRVLFYCHFPDLLLSQRSSVFKSLYRFPLDYLEQSSTGAADLILVNSKFTAGVFGQTFKRLARQGVEPAVLYPAVSIPSDAVLSEASKVWKMELSDEIVQFIGDKPVFLSINRWVVSVSLCACILLWCAVRGVGQLVRTYPDWCSLGEVGHLVHTYPAWCAICMQQEQLGSPSKPFKGCTNASTFASTPHESCVTSTPSSLQTVPSPGLSARRASGWP